MYKSLILLLVFLLGCNTSQNDGDQSSLNTTPNSAANSLGGTQTIFAVPHPNSGKFSTDEAAKLLPQFLQRSTPIQKSNTIVTQWESPTQAIRIHVTADDTVEIVDYLGRKLTGIDSIDGALNSTMTHGNERSVLLTSDIAGWESPTKRAVIDILFQPLRSNLSRWKQRQITMRCTRSPAYAWFWNGRSIVRTRCSLTLSDSYQPNCPPWRNLLQ